MDSNSNSNSNSKQRSQLMMLKDFLLLEDSTSCSSSGFNSFPRFPNSCNTNSPSLQQCPHRASRTFRKLRSKSAISVLHKLITSVKSPVRKKSSTTKDKKENSEIFVRVRVKDILRWRSFRDLIDGVDEVEKARPLDCLTASPDGRSRFDRKGNVGGEDPMMAGTGKSLCGYCDHVGPSNSDQLSNDEEDQHSPVSVLASPFRDDEDSSAYFDESLANVERTKQRLLESIKWLEGLAGVKPVDSDEDEIDLLEEPTEEQEEDHPIVNSLTDGLKSKSYYCKDEKSEAKLAKEAKANVVCKEAEETEELEECVSEIEKEAESRVEEQRKQLMIELELTVLNALLDELLFNLVGK